ncbi:hypothetical protein E2562_025366 [Oryza meyeriana var. granulata]|uniref:Uncharacterized protein n=1 Tax=Oryza meyeriana var. granulata TaxID=110450 RepID=A0A6G1DP22_9ORYZ|nr:hypothetical protein E2562_025366 [Oryza meyeriana var. granulata]
MELLDMVPPDAIALRLYSLPAAAATAVSLWAWLVAALAAAVGLWRIRAAGARSALVDDDKQKMKQPPSAPQSSVPAAVDEARPARAEAEAEALVATPSSPMSEPSTPSKVRFTAYYGGTGDDADGAVDSVRRCAERDNDNDDDNGSGVRVGGEGQTPLRRTASRSRRRTTPTALMSTPWEEREMAVRRRGDLGWYRHLNMAAFDGSVVRLWDGEVTTAVSSPRGRSRRRVLSELHLAL